MFFYQLKFECLTSVPVQGIYKNKTGTMGIRLMGHLSPRLDHLRQTLAGLDPSLGPGLAKPARALPLRIPTLDAVLGGGLAKGALHEFAPAAPIHLGAATGFAVALATSGDRQAGDSACGSRPIPPRRRRAVLAGPGLDLFGMAADRLIVLRVPRVADALWAMEEALRCHALAGVIAELPGNAVADLTATRRLTLAARDGGGLGLLLHQRATSVPSAAATRWQIAAAPSRPDAFGGLGRAAFDLSLVKNRRGPSGRWMIEWSQHERAFHAALSLAVAETTLDRSDRAPSVRMG